MNHCKVDMSHHEVDMSHPEVNMQGRIQGGGPFWGTPKLHKEGEKVARVRAKKPHFST